MKLFVKLLILVVMLALAGPFFIKGPDGQPFWKVGALKQSVQLSWKRLQRTFSGAVDNVDIPGVDSSVTVYRWQDADGQWHYSQEAPEGINSDALSIDPKTNLVTLPPLAKEPPVPDAASDTDESAPAPVTGPLPDIEATRQLIEDAKGLQDVVDARDKKLRELDQ